MKYVNKLKILALVIASCFPLTGTVAKANSAPMKIECSGSEPFWMLNITNGSAKYNDFTGNGDIIKQYRVSKTAPVQNRRGRWLYTLVSRDQEEDLVALIEQRSCDNGTSDHNFPYQITLIGTDANKHAVGGCCM